MVARETRTATCRWRTSMLGHRGTSGRLELGRCWDASIVRDVDSNLDKHRVIR